MSPSPPRSEAHEALGFTLDVVRACCPIALAYRDGLASVLALRHKPRGGGPITAADREINRRLVEALRQRFPGDAILAEESEQDARWRTARRCWHVDPIDGTREFARGRPDWTIQVGLCVEGRPVLGVIAEPATDRLTWGLVLEGEALAMHRRGDDPAVPLGPSSPSPTMSTLVLMTGKPHPMSREQAVRKALGVAPARSRNAGSVGVRMISVARGDADLYVQPPGRAKTWDTCAPEAVLRAMGARVTDLRGHALDYRGPTPSHAAGVLATSPTLHAAVLDRLTRLTERWLGPPAP